MSDKKGLIGEFKEFIMRGNVMDMAVGVIIGGAFGSIITSLVDDILMPVISLATGGLDSLPAELRVNSRHPSSSSSWRMLLLRACWEM